MKQATDKKEWPQVMRGEVQDGYQERLHLRKSSGALEQAAQGGSGVIFPGGVQELHGCGTDGGVQWTWDDGMTVGLDVLSHLFQPILHACCKQHTATGVGQHLLVSVFRQKGQKNTRDYYF